MISSLAGRKFRRRLVMSGMGLWLLVVGASLAAPPPADDTGGEAARPVVAVVTVHGGIFLGTAEYLTDAMERAASEHITALVIEMDTPGGALDETQDIVKGILSATLPVVVFVSPKGAQAASAGTFITMAGHVAAMAPGTRIGAAHPVMLGGLPGLPGGGNDKKDEQQQKQKQQDIMQEKVTNDTVSFIRSIARERGRNEQWAEKAVRESASITADEAVQLKVIDLVAEDLDDLLKKIDGRQVKLGRERTVTLHTTGARVERWGKSLKQKLLGALAHPNLLYLLFLIGLGGIAMEFYHPGLIVPGAVGGLCLLLALISMQVLPVSIGGLLLVLAGVGLLIAEAFVTSYGMLAIGGSILLLLGGIMLVDPASQPHYLDPTLSVDWSVMIPTVVMLALGIVFIGYKVIRTQRRRIETGMEGMVGLEGQARSDINSEGGQVFVRGEHWRAVSTQPIAKGAKVVVERAEGLLLHVKGKNQ